MGEDWVGWKRTKQAGSRVSREHSRADERAGNSGQSTPRQTMIRTHRRTRQTAQLSAQKHQQTRRGDALNGRKPFFFVATGDLRNRAN